MKIFIAKIKNINTAIRYAEQKLAASKSHLETHKHARGHAWIKHPMLMEEVEPLLAMIIMMGLVSLPTIR